MSPTIVSRDGEPLFTLGTPGGLRIFGSVLQAIVNVIDHAMTLQEAVEAPRMFDRGTGLEVEQGFPDIDELKAGLARLGHSVATPLKVAGGMNAIWREPATGLLSGSACWRADGAAAGYSGGDGVTAQTGRGSWE